MTEQDGMPEETEEMEEITEAIESASITKEEIAAEKEAITEAVQESIREATGDAIKDAVREALQSEDQNYDQEEIEEMTETAYHLLTKTPEETNQNKIIQKEAIHSLEGIKGSEGTPRPYNYPSEPDKKAKRNLPWGQGKTTEAIPEKQRLQATKEGLEQYLQRNLPDHERERTEQKLEDISQRLQELPDEPEQEQDEEEETQEPISDEQAQSEGYADAQEQQAWAEGTESIKKLSKNIRRAATLTYIKDLASIGITPKDLTELTKDWDNQIKEMSKMFSH
jgi:hypothetical protein